MLHSFTHSFIQQISAQPSSVQALSKAPVYAAFDPDSDTKGRHCHHFASQETGSESLSKSWALSGRARTWTCISRRYSVWLVILGFPNRPGLWNQHVNKHSRCFCTRVVTPSTICPKWLTACPVPLGGEWPGRAEDSWAMSHGQWKMTVPVSNWPWAADLPSYSSPCLNSPSPAPPLQSSTFTTFVEWMKSNYIGKWYNQVICCLAALGLRN